MENSERLRWHVARYPSTTALSIAKPDKTPKTLGDIALATKN